MYRVNAGRTPQLLNAQCTVAEQVGDLVYCSANMAGGYLVVRTADGTDVDKLPVVGAIVSKVSDTHAVVQTSGLVKSIYAGLTVGKIYHCDSAGRPSIVFPRPGFFHPVAKAVGITALFLQPSTRLVQLV